ncbi:MAG: hypothetical protein WCT11_04470 [Candidatus Magasanikbacteria bacterium]
MSLVARLPYFTIENLATTGEKAGYLRILLSRYAKSGVLARLKKGIYVKRSFLDDVEKKQNLPAYQEFTANILNTPSYLSLEYVLYNEGILTEMPVNFTSVTLNKTKKFRNEFGNFIYHNIKLELFCGFNRTKINDWEILKATRAKALFDFIYFRKDILPDARAVEELRLNLSGLDAEDKKELKKYCDIARDKKVNKIFNLLDSGFNPE